MVFEWFGVLTVCECEVLVVVVCGLSNVEVGCELFMSEVMVKVYVSRLFVKLDVGNCV